MDFDDPNPRSAPVPKLFSPVSSGSSVPEVSLVFSPSPISVMKVGRAPKQYLDIHSQTPSLKDIINYPTILHDNENSRKECYDSRPELHTGRNTSLFSIPSMRNQENVIFPGANNRFIQDDFSKYLPQSYMADEKMEDHVGRTYGGTDRERKSPSLQKSYVPPNRHPQLFKNTEIKTVDEGGEVSETDLNVQYTTLHVSHMTAKRHHTEDVMHTNQRAESRLPYNLQNTCENSTATPPSRYQFNSNQQHCVNDLRNCYMIANNGVTFNSNVPVYMNSNCLCHFPHSDPSNCRTCISHVSCVESSNNLRNDHLCNFQSNDGLKMPTDKISKCNEAFEHFGEGRSDLCQRNSINGDEALPVNNCSILQQNPSLACKYNHSSERKNRRKNDLCQRNSVDGKDEVFPVSNRSHLQQNQSKYNHNSEINTNSSDICEVQRANTHKHFYTKGNNAEELYRQECQFKNGNDETKKKPLLGNSKKPNERSTDSSILQEIALMNQKQCSILQGLLQQVVVMQADQMKILSEINEKLSHTRLSEAEPPKRCSDTPVTLSKSDNATTQTSFIGKTDSCYKNCGGKSDEAVLPNVNNSIRNTPANHIFRGNNVESNKIFPIMKVIEQETDHNKSKKVQERAVSWSAVHGVETVEESFTLHGVCVPTVVDQLPSSVHTMHLHVQDYNSSASFDSISETRQVSEGNCNENGQNNPTGSWTLYDNIVGHVKKFLQTVPCEKNGNVPQKTSQVEAIRFATIEKIRQLGVNVYENSTKIKEVNATGRIHFDSQVASHNSFHNPSPITEKCSSDASLEIQTLALKYLQDDDLCELANWNQSSKTSSILKTGQRSCNISLATQHYLEKYNLLPFGTDCKYKRHVNTNCGQVCLEDNILDITSLKKQPKLL